jgi:hypothetical protein
MTALPGMGSVFLLMSIIFYIGAVMATKLFSDSFPSGSARWATRSIPCSRS